LDAERLCARRARRAEAQDGPSKVACGAFSGHHSEIRRQLLVWPKLPKGNFRRGFCRLRNRVRLRRVSRAPIATCFAGD